MINQRSKKVRRGRSGSGGWQEDLTCVFSQ